MNTTEERRMGEGDYLYELRTSRGYTLSQAAYKLTIHRTTLWRYEQGVIRKIPESIRSEICLLYGISDRDYDDRYIPEREIGGGEPEILLTDEEFVDYYYGLSLREKTRIQLIAGAIRLARVSTT